MKRIILLTLIFVTAMQHLHGRSVVYNFRIAQITKQHIFEAANTKKNTVIGLIFDELAKKRYNDIHTNYFGGLGTYIYTLNNYFLRADFAVSLVQQKSSTGCFSNTQTDDVLFTLGKNFPINERSDVTLSGLFGIPTHRPFALLGPDFGYGQYGIGVQLDSLYKFNDVNSLILGGRYVYFIPRCARDTVCNRYKFTVGNLIDLLIANKNTWQKHSLELGFTSRFLFGGKIFPYLPDAIAKSDYTRLTWYAVYQYKFKLAHTVNRLLFNIAPGFDVSPKKFGNKYIVFMWGAWDLKF